MARHVWPDEIKASFERLVAKSTAARTRIFRDAVGFVKKARENKIDMLAASRAVTSLLSEGIAGYARLQIDYASRMIDLGVSVTHGMLSSFGTTGEPASAAPQNEAAPAAFALQVSGMPGDCCRTAFILESTKKKTVVATFRHTAFHTMDNSVSLNVPLRFDPSVITLDPDRKTRIVLEAPIPLDATPGRYAASAWIGDVPELHFKIALTVMVAAEKNPPGPAAAGKNDPAAKNKKAKKTPKKK